MELKPYRLLSVIAILTIVFISCSPDDDAPTAPPPRDRAEQQIADKDSLITYLSTHYYNASFFETPSNQVYSDIIITELPKDEDGNYLDMPDPANNMLLIDAVDTYETEYFDTTYEYYVLRLNQGGGDSPHFSDFVRVKYQGFDVEDQDIFDEQVTPQDLSLVGNGFNTFSAIRAWQLILPTFNAAEGFGFSGDGIISYDNFGLGVMFIPSGLAYFSNSVPGISLYSNLIFKFELLQFEELDHDGDLIATFLEDLNMNMDVTDDDTDADGLPNFFDLDDDNDSVFTIDELFPKQYVIDTNMGEEEPVLEDNEFEVTRTESNGVITINTVTVMDTNDDGIPDYLNDDIAINYNMEEDEN